VATGYVVACSRGFKGSTATTEANIFFAEEFTWFFFSEAAAVKFFFS
jgi:hypothetical protein